MNYIKNDQVLMNGKSSLLRRLITWVTTFFFIFQFVSPAMASMMSDQSIENDLAINHEFVQELTNAYYQYVGSPYINASAPVGDLTSIEEMLDVVVDEHDIGVGGPTYVPIGTGGITTFITTYPNYKLVGDPLVQSRFVRTQIRAMLGRTLIDSSKTNLYGSESIQLKTLFQNAINYLKSDPSKRIGDRLGFEQDGAPLAAPMIWPELRTIHGKEVLVPIVYLTATELARRVEGNTTEINQGGTFGDLIIEGTTVKFGRDAFLMVLNNLINNQGYIDGEGNLTINVGGQLRNLSGLIQSEGNLEIAAKSIFSGTIIHQYSAFNSSGEQFFGEIAEINSVNGDVVLRAYQDIVIAGSVVEAGNDIRFTADGNVYVGTVNISNTENRNREGGWRIWQQSNVEYLGSVLSAEESIEIIANGEIQIDASEILADNGHIQLLAGLGITVQDQLNVSESYQQGKFGKTSKEVSEYKTIAIRSFLDAGTDITINAVFGDITLKAVDITSTQGTTANATNGAINVLVTTETDHYSYSSVRKGTFTTKTRERGHNIETVLPTTIVGGFEANPLYGLNIEYEGDPNLSLNEQLIALEGMPGLDWIKLARESTDDVTWTAVEAKYEEWNRSNTTLSPAALAIITIVVTVATAGAASTIAASAAQGAASLGVGAATGTAATAIGAGAAAASVSLITASTIASANALVNDGDIFDALQAHFDTITSSDALRSAAISAVTAGAVSALNAEFFNFDGPSPLTTIDEVTGKPSLTLLGQVVQAAAESSVSAGISTIASGGDLGDFRDVFVSSVLNTLASNFGANLASRIGQATDLNELSRYLAHAALGCGLGALNAEINDSETDSGSACSSGAGGAVIGELTGTIFGELGFDESDPDFNFENWRNTGIGIAEIAAAFVITLAGGDTNIAALTGRNAAENNALSLKEKAKYGVQGARCFFARDTASCLQDVARAAFAQNIANDVALSEGLLTGLKSEAAALAELDDAARALLETVLAGDVGAIASGLQQALAGIPESLLDQADAVLSLAFTADGPDQYREIGERLAPLVIDILFGVATLGVGFVAKQSVEAIADTASAVRRIRIDRDGNVSTSNGNNGSNGDSDSNSNDDSSNSNNDGSSSNNDSSNNQNNRTCSFHGDTLVLTNNGLLPIKDVTTEMSVFSRNAVTGQTGLKQVQAQYWNKYAETVSISIRDTETGVEQTIVSNKIHPYFVQTTRSVVNSSEGHVYNGVLDNGYWVDAAELKAQDRLLNDDGSWAEVVSVSVETKPLQAFNLTVADFHTYFVAGNDAGSPVWVHNNCINGTEVTLLNGNKIILNASDDRINHVLLGDNNHSKGTSSGGHSTNSGSVKTVGDVQSGQHGVRLAQIEVNGVLKTSGPNGMSTLFPESWSDQRIVDEFSAGLRAGVTSHASSGAARVTTPSGVIIEFTRKGTGPNTADLDTFYPVFIERVD